MAALTLPSQGSIYLDTSAIIYSVERSEPYLALLAPVWRQAEAGQLVLVCSELAIAETLVGPIREESPELERAFRDVFAAPEVQVAPATRQLWEDAAQSIEQAIDLWIDTAQEFGDPVPEPRGERLMLA